jgi:hypothetical protein
MYLFPIFGVSPYDNNNNNNNEMERRWKIQRGQIADGSYFESINPSIHPSRQEIDGSRMLLLLCVYISRKIVERMTGFVVCNS